MNHKNNNYKKCVCNNCGISGHLFYKCKKPIMSFGIICYREKNNTIEYLMIRRKDSLGYVDFLRGKYNQYNDFHLKNIILEMTKEEINNIINNNYVFLWNKLWNKDNEKYDKKNLEKFNYIKINKLNLFLNAIHSWNEPEWGFPKGRRNSREGDYDCALREFEEETGYSCKNLNIIKNINFFEEVFTGSNLKSYKHKYYLCKMNYNHTLNEKNFQKSEIGDLKWFSYTDCLNNIRYYNTEKKEILEKINKILIKNNE